MVSENLLLLQQIITNLIKGHYTLLVNQQIKYTHFKKITRYIYCVFRNIQQNKFTKQKLKWIGYIILQKIISALVCR